MCKFKKGDCIIYGDCYGKIIGVIESIDIDKYKIKWCDETPETTIELTKNIDGSFIKISEHKLLALAL